MSKSKEYLAFKNYLHNELKITKEESRQIAIQALKDEAVAEAKRIIQQSGQNLKLIVEKAIVDTTLSVINGKSGSYTDRDKFFSGLGKEIAKQINIK